MSYCPFQNLLLCAAKKKENVQSANITEKKQRVSTYLLRVSPSLRSIHPYCQLHIASTPRPFDRMPLLDLGK